MFDAQADPLGIGVQTRARDKRLAFMNGAGFGHGSNVLPDPKWDGFFQAMDEANVSGVGDDSVGVKKGMWDAKPASPSTYGPGQTSAVDTMPSNQIGVAGPSAPFGIGGTNIPSMDALLRSLGPVGKLLNKRGTR